ncbi:MAG TPA: PrgI family protein [Candidatus Paceibacterota bacterium]
MAQYQVPQFIEVEDKIFGPLTLKQFIYLAGAGGLSLIFFTLLPLLLALPLIGLAVGIGAAFAFYKVNGRPLINAAEHAFAYFFGNKLYLWKQREVVRKPQAKQSAPVDAATLVVPRLSQSRLKDLSWSLNIKDQNQQMTPTDPVRSKFEI